jgi:hypothetical protein
MRRWLLCVLPLAGCGDSLLGGPSLDEVLGLNGPLEGSSSTPISWDAKAFTYWDGNAIVPVGWWAHNPESGYSENGSAAVIIDIDVNGTLTEVGRVTHPTTKYCDGGIVYEDEPVPPEQPHTDSDDAEAEFVDPPSDESPPVTTIPPDWDDEGRYCETWTPEIQRSVIIGGDLYTLSEGGVMVSTFDDLDMVTWIPFEQR